MSHASSLSGLLDALGCFDAGWYLAANDDVRANGADPLEHFIQGGFAEGRAPGPVAGGRGGESGACAPFRLPESGAD